MYNFLVGLFQNTLRSATPVVIAAMGGLFTEHAGLMNIGMDGMMLIGAFFAAVCSYFFASAAMGVLVAVLIGILIGLFFGLFVIHLKSDEFIIGVALNIFAGALTVFLLRTMFSVKGSFTGTAGRPVVALPTVRIPLLADIPFVGDILGNNSILTYVSWIVVIAAWAVIYKTPFGFRLRASGEMPDSLKSLGMSPVLMKYAASVICGALCGLAGAHLSLGYLTGFSEGMSASRGFIAYACIIFGVANPPKVFLAVLLFGFLDALGLRLQGVGISSYLTSAIPYIATVLVLIAGALREKAKQAKNRDLVHEVQ